MQDNQELDCGMTAKMLLVKKIGNNTPECISEGKDVYKRTLAECFINGESLSSFLVRSGYAFAYRKYSKKFIKDEDFAKANKLGMWAMTFQYPWDFRKAS
jgi:endonuclease YncB( thermonuclease family)